MSKRSRLMVERPGKAATIAFPSTIPLDADEEACKALLRSLAKAAQQKGKQFEIIDGELYLDGRHYYVEGER